MADKFKLARQREDELARYRDMQNVEPQDDNSLQFALVTHKIFMTLANYLRGLFVGLALWQIVQVYTLTNNGYDVFLENYYELAIPVQSVYFFLLAFSIVSTFDRFVLTFTFITGYFPILQHFSPPDPLLLSE